MLAKQRNRPSMRYSRQVRFLLGTTRALLKDWTVEGRRYTALNCTERYILIHKDFWVRIQTEIARVKLIQGDGVSWVLVNRAKEDCMFNNDHLLPRAAAGEFTEAHEP